MPIFNFTGTSQTDTNTGNFFGSTSHPNITFTYSFTTNGTSSFDGSQFALTSTTSFAWTATLTLSVIPTTPITSVLFSTSSVSGFALTTDSTMIGAIQFVTFTFSGSSGTLFITDFNAQCFLHGTKIATPDGEVAVQDLVPGDRVLTAQRGETEVQWLGRQEIETRMVHPAKYNPICISAGALAAGVPKRDLYLSADHAVELGGMLINAGALVNGRSIYQVRDMPLDGFTYYHVETQAHELIVAEGCSAESYLDVPNRDSFVNGEERAGVPPIQEMDMVRISAARLVPEKIRARVAGRSGIKVAA